MISKVVRFVRARRPNYNSQRRQASLFPSENDVVELLGRQTVEELFEETRPVGPLVLKCLSQSRRGIFSPLSVVGDGPAEQWAKRARFELLTHPVYKRLWLLDGR